MPQIRKIGRQAAGKIRRFVFSHIRKAYVEQQLTRRQGECNQCGKCCEILLRCPFLVRVEDGASICRIYHRRPGSCAAFPLNEKCLSEVDFDCTYSFGNAPSNLTIEPSPVLNQAD